jgi:dTDP-4-amino-4,6-dideoxygalactose transaminase
MRDLKKRSVGDYELSVPFFNYPNIYQQYKKEYLETIENVLSRGAYIMQQELADFEEQLQNYLGVKHAIGTADGTMALLMSLLALNLKPGDEVIVPTHTFVASASAIHHSRATPVVVDCGPDHLVTPNAIEHALTEKTKVIMPVQLNGRVAEMDEIMRIAKQHNLYVVEDACQALGAKFNNKFAGTFGDTGAFSFYPSKTLGAFGDAGAVVTNNDTLAEKIKMLRDHGRSKDTVKCWGFNARMDNIHAAILKIKLARYDQEIDKRRNLAAIYNAELKDIEELKLPPAPEHDEHYDIFQNYEIEALRRDELMLFLKDKNVQTIKQWGGELLHQFDHLKGKTVKDVSYANSMVHNYMLLPMNTSLSEIDVNYVCKLIHNFYR